MERHGSFTIARKKNIIYTTFIGKWNIECANAYETALKEEITKIGNKPWFEITDLSCWENSTPTAQKKMIELLKWRFKNNLTLNFLIKPDIIVRTKAEELIDEKKIMFLDTVEQAQEFIEKKQQSN